MKPISRHPTRLLSAHAEGALDPRRASRVEEHLAACIACSREWERWSALYRDLASLPRPRVPAGLRNRIVAAIAQEGAPVLAPVAARWVEARRRWEILFPWVYAAGVAMAGAVIIGLALVPSVREWVASGLAGASASGLRAGLFVVDVLSAVSSWAGAAGRFLVQGTEWTGALGRALEALGNVAEVRLASLLIVGLGIVVFSLFFLRFLHHSEPEGEVSHVGPLLA